jgi:hypothetical protein
LCVRSSDFGAREAMERQRATSLFADLPTILRYPLSDPMALGVLAVVVWIFTAMRSLSFGFYGAGACLLFSQGLLMAYAFNALIKVSNGQMQGFMPEISDIWDLAAPLRQSFAALVASWWLVGVALLLAPSILSGSGLGLLAVNDPTPVVHAQAPEPEDFEDDQASPTPDPVDTFLAQAGRDSEGRPLDLPPSSSMADFPQPSPARSVGVLLLFAIGILWGIVYSPIALIVAALARDEGFVMGFLQPLNPVNSIIAIRRMESTYWQAMAVYLLIVVLEFVLGLLFGWIPILGSVVLALVGCYARLATGCALGLAVFKRSRELGLD